MKPARGAIQNQKEPSRQAAPARTCCTMDLAISITPMDADFSTLSPDDEAMRRVAAGDSSALAPLFERHKGKLYGFLLHLVGDRAAAEDLLGETFLHVYRGRHQYRLGGGFSPWLFR